MTQPRRSSLHEAMLTFVVAMPLAWAMGEVAVALGF